ncbi:MAG: hypothetical protein GYB68_00065 [Chloroflexi bacterium]|nr:hypothetical protein [Chloroflexota bacterium]
MSTFLFKLSREQQRAYKQWRDQIDERVFFDQIETGKDWRGMDLPYSVRETLRQRKLRRIHQPWYGMNQDAYTFMFTPTRLGMVVRVRNVHYGDELDLSEEL